MPDDPKLQTSTPATPASAVVRDSARRRLIKTGLAAAPVVMAFTSQPALGTCGVCTTPSRHASLKAFNSVHPGEKSYSCTGRSPGYWKVPQHFGDWKVTHPTLKTHTTSGWVLDTGPGVPPLNKFCSDEKIWNSQFGASFASFFGSNDMLPCVPSGWPTCALDTTRAVSMWEVLAYPNDVRGGAYAQLARHLVAAYLNMLSISTYPVSLLHIKAMWTERVSGYRPTAGSTPWTTDDIIAYLKCTFDGLFPD